MSWQTSKTATVPFEGRLMIRFLGLLLGLIVLVDCVVISWYFVLYGGVR